MPRLVIESPDFAGQIFELAEPKISVGRIPDNDIQIADASISSKHGEFRQEGGDYRVIDFNSTNGTRVNDERITESILRNNDILMLGNVILRYESENVVSAPPLPEAEQDFIVEMGVLRGRPANFKNLAPFPKAVASSASFPIPVLIALILLLGSVGFFCYKMFMG